MASAAFGIRPVAQINAHDVVAALRPMETAGKHESATPDALDLRPGATLTTVNEDGHVGHWEWAVAYQPFGIHDIIAAL